MLRCATIVSEWIDNIGLDPKLYGTHSLRRTKATLICRRTDFGRPQAKPDHSDSLVTDWLIDPEEYDYLFVSRVFDEWYRKDVGKVPPSR